MRLHSYKLDKNLAYYIQADPSTQAMVTSYDSLPLNHSKNMKSNISQHPLLTLSLKNLAHRVYLCLKHYLCCLPSLLFPKHISALFLSWEQALLLWSQKRAPSELSLQPKRCHLNNAEIWHGCEFLYHTYLPFIILCKAKNLLQHYSVKPKDLAGTSSYLADVHWQGCDSIVCLLADLAANAEHARDCLRWHCSKVLVKLVVTDLEIEVLSVTSKSGLCVCLVL